MEVALIGNPNSGKTTVFNALTGSSQRVGNWPGVTVEKKTGCFVQNGQQVSVVDLPGTYSLNILSHRSSLDERVASDYLLSDQPRWIVSVVDASHLERSLYLTLQLLEMGLPLILAVNMLDVAKQQGIRVDLKALSQRLGCPVIGLEANKGRGIADLKKVLVNASELVEPLVPAYASTIEITIAELADHLVQQRDVSASRARWLAIRLLEEDALAETVAGNLIVAEAKKHRERLSTALDEDLDIIMADRLYTIIQEELQPCISKKTKVLTRLTECVDSIVLNRVLGIPIFLMVMYTMFLFAINVGGVFQDFFDLGGQAVFIQGVSHALAYVGAPAWFVGIVGVGVGLGITTTLTFIPVIGAMFFFLSFLEASGYMARAAFVVDRLMRSMGLPGKSFVPMIVGFGCNVPAVMGARTLEHRRDRILTVMMSPFMSCGARLAIYAVFVSAFFPTGGQNVIFGLYLIGILMAVLTGFLLRKTLLAGDNSPLLMELPNYHLPRFRSLLRRTWQRLKGFLLKASKVIIPLCVVVGFLNAFSLQNGLTLDPNGQEGSLLASLGQTITPLFSPMGISSDNWPATVGLLTGMLAKEVVVATLNTLYTQMSHVGLMVDASNISVLVGLKEAFMTIPDNLIALKDSIWNPILASAPVDEVSGSFYGEMYRRFDGRIGAFAYLLFVLLYFPCVTTTAAMVRELNRAWALFSVFWTTGIAYVASVMFYQIATFARHPASSTAWVLGLSAVVLAVITLLKIMASMDLDALIDDEVICEPD